MTDIDLDLPDVTHNPNSNETNIQLLDLKGTW